MAILVIRFEASAAALAHDPHQAFAVSDRVIGVQFHPEFDADIIRGYAAERAEKLAAEGIDAAAVQADARDAPHGERILRNFAAMLTTARTR